ncbi:MAG: helix-turn-helix domain-containing protein [Tannerella sp.]|nr:helix-turn-helix domain-containing protein [Tannerella sp.]
MKEICGRVTEYLQTTKAYTNPDFTIHMLSGETGIQWKNISAAINGYLNKNFFDLVNGMRVEEAKREFLSLGDNYTIDSIYTGCGFRSRTSFFRVFKKFEGITPTSWFKNNS